MRRIRERLARLEAVASSGAGCEGCNTPIDLEAMAGLCQRLKEASTPAYQRRRAVELAAEADRREAAEADLSATGRTDAAVPAGDGAARQAGTDPAVDSLCSQCQFIADLAHRIGANMAAAERERTPEDLRREAREALDAAERLEQQDEAKGSNW